MADFFQQLTFFSGKTAFLQISADFVTWFEKFFFHLKALQTRMQIDKNNFFVAQVVPEIYTKNHRLINSQIYVFASHCTNHHQMCYSFFTNLYQYFVSLNTMCYQNCQDVEFASVCKVHSYKKMYQFLFCVVLCFKIINNILKDCARVQRLLYYIPDIRLLEHNQC